MTGITASNSNPVAKCFIKRVWMKMQQYTADNNDLVQAKG
jgi:hypothetical protein